MAQEEEICTRISESVKMAGFLEKKGKMKIVSAWKKYWFVLEERLLLYYRSQIEYINLSPCRGSLNMGLVTTVRPGSSTGPCIIHVITRTQVVQLRAKNRETQEEWLQALLDSMSLPLFSKTLKTPLIADLHCHRYSMDNIPSHERLRKTESERNEKSNHVLDYKKKEISDSFYGGSLDTVVWSKKFRTVQTPSPNIPRGKMMEKILGYVEEADSKSTSDMVSLIGDDVGSSSLRFDRKKSYMDKVDFPCDSSAFIKDRKSLSDNELNRTVLLNDDKMKTRSREESQFERIKNAMKKTREKAFKGKGDLEAKPSSVKKRRQSFLQKVFKRHYRIENDKEVPEDDSDMDDPLYDTIQSVQEQKESLMSSNSESSQEQKETKEQGEVELTEDEETASHTNCYNPEIQKPVFGSKSILPAQAMSELKNKLKSRESIDKEEEEESCDIPDLPPRRSSRPRSPWHDVPANNAPVDGAEPNFNMHQTTVKFHDDFPDIFHNPPERIKESSEEKPGKSKSDDLNILLEQLTEITTGSLHASQPVQEDGTAETNADWEKPTMGRRLSDPDYDIPRPHKLANLCISEDDKTSDEHKPEDCSDTSLSFHSIEPDSLESPEKKKL